MLTKLILYYHTLRYLRFEQVAFRVFYLLRSRFWRLIGFKPYAHFLKIAQKNSKLKTQNLKLTPSVSAPVPMIFGEKHFNFLNLKQDFDQNDMDWDFAEHGKLWTYNLNYFEFLHQNDLDTEGGLKLIEDFIQKLPTLKTAHEPFPTALRLVFTIRFLIQNSLTQSHNLEISQSLHAQAHVLRGSLERHLLGNHLLENGFGLLFAAYFFEDKKLYTTAKWILERELTEQILPDGAHFELSPMYHQHMFYRVLDCVNLAKNNPSLDFGFGMSDFGKMPNSSLLDFLIEKAEIMFGWLEQITFKNGQIPLLADSAEGIAPTSQQLFDYAKRLNLTPQYFSENASGYYKIDQFENYECVVDVGNIGPDYIPGHAHSDTFGFVLNVNNQPFIVDLGVSTYEKNARRQLERATNSHNTVQIGNAEQTEVWGGFRVARRARIVGKVTGSGHPEYTILRATHDGYKSKFGVLHERIFTFTERKIEITDKLIGETNELKTAYLHFHSDIGLVLEKNTILTPSVKISFEGHTNIILEKYELPTGFNQSIESQRACISFEKQDLKTIISIL